MVATSKDFSFQEYYSGNLDWLEKRTIFLTVHGSRSYGTALPESDYDFKGIAIPPKDYYFGLLDKFEQADKFNGVDCTIYELRKFCALATNCNPNIIEILFTDPDMFVIKHPIMDKLIQNRNLFLSKKARWSFAGYAYAQLKRINSHYKWLKNPPTHKPTRKEFDLPEHTSIPRDQLKAAEALIVKKMDQWNFNFDVIEDRDKRLELQAKIHNTLYEIAGASMFLENEKLHKHAAVHTALSQNIIEIVVKEKKYKSKMNEWTAYNKWKEERNPERAALEAKFGFDSKHAMHLIRLLRVCEEVLTTGEVKVKRPDAAELLEIRNGAWSYEQLIEWSTVQDKKIQELYDTTDVLPYEPNKKAINKLCMEMMEEYHE